jgi:hypothetical protein
LERPGAGTEAKRRQRAEIRAVRFKQQIDRAARRARWYRRGPRIVRKPTKGFGHLEAAGRSDLMLENLVIDREKPYHRFFSPETIRVSEKRMADVTSR